MTGELMPYVPTGLVMLLLIVLLIWVPFRRSVLGRGCYAVGSAEGAAYMSGVKIGRSKLAAYTLCGVLAGIAGLMQTFNTYTGEASAPSGRPLHAQLDCRRGHRRHLAVRRLGRRRRLDLRRLHPAHDRQPAVRLDMPPLWQPLFQGVVLLLAVSLGAALRAADPQPSRAVPLSSRAPPQIRRSSRHRRLRLHRRDAAGRQLYSTNFLSPRTCCSSCRSPRSSASSRRRPCWSSCSAISTCRSPGW